MGRLPHPRRNPACRPIGHNERRYITKPHKDDTGCPDWVDAVFERYRARIREVEEGVVLLPGVEVVDAPTTEPSTSSSSSSR
jgi:hypothetical protein